MSSDLTETINIGSIWVQRSSRSAQITRRVVGLENCPYRVSVLNVLRSLNEGLSLVRVEVGGVDSKGRPTRFQITLKTFKNIYEPVTFPTLWEHLAKDDELNEVEAYVEKRLGIECLRFDFRLRKDGGIATYRAHIGPTNPCPCGEHSLLIAVRNDPKAYLLKTESLTEEESDWVLRKDPISRVLQCLYHSIQPWPQKLVFHHHYRGFSLVSTDGRGEENVVLSS